MQLLCPWCAGKVAAVGEDHTVDTIDSAPPVVVGVEDEPRVAAQTRFLRFASMWDFDNIGVSRPEVEVAPPSVELETVTIHRYLVCADCDRGPLGFAGSAAANPDPAALTYWIGEESCKRQ